jgi:hypothetical protein
MGAYGPRLPETRFSDVSDLDPETPYAWGSAAVCPAGTSAAVTSAGFSE